MSTVVSFLSETYTGIFFLAAAFITAGIGIFLVFRSPSDEIRKLGWRVIWATIAVTIIQYALLVWDGEKSPTNVLGVLGIIGFLIVVSILHYWCVPLLIRWPYKNEYRHSWHVWAAWSAITVHLLWESLVHKKEFAFLMFLGFVWFPPLAALVGVIIAEALLRLKKIRREM
jgi:hypothetical protein